MELNHIHGCLNPYSILLDDNNNCYLADYSQYLLLKDINDINFTSPDIIKSNYYSNDCDIWSFGCCIYYIVTNEKPFEGKNNKETINNILLLNFKPLSNKLYNNIIKRIFVKNKLSKITLSECLILLEGIIIYYRR